MNIKYLELLAKQFKNRQEIISEIINLNTILTLPKGTEFFFSDLHGEHESFLHLLRSASGIIKRKIDMLYTDKLSDIERQKLAHLIYYPRKQMEQLNIKDNDLKNWYKENISRLIHVARYCSSKYTRSKVNKKLPKEHAYIITELFNCHNDEYRQSYYHEIIEIIIANNNAIDFIIALTDFIKDICIDYIHILGDIYDRGPRPDLIIDALMKYNDVDIQWGNHDISWMGAACGNEALIANVIRIAISYNNFDLLEDGYGINLRPLSDFARNVYKDDLCIQFTPHILDENKYDIVEKSLTAKMHKAITIIQLKLEGQIIGKHPEYDMNELQWLKQIDYNNQTVSYLNREYILKDNYLPTIDINHPLKLSSKEENLMNTLKASFKRSERLQKHIQYIYSRGNMYKIMNGHLMFHGCIPFNRDGTLRNIKIHNRELNGKELLDELELTVRNAYFNHENIDDMWYLWCSKNSPVYGKSKVSLFEKYFIDDKVLKKEEYDPYYHWIKNEKTCYMLLDHFEVKGKNRHIINGHVPVKIKDGERPIKANGKLYVIDGGIAKAYQSKTGTAGYTLIYDSRCLQLAKHQPYNIEAKEGLLCLTPEIVVTERMECIKNKDCDLGKLIEDKIEDLKLLLNAYYKGLIKER